MSKTKTNTGWIFEQLEGRTNDGRVIHRLKDNIDAMPTDLLGTAVRTERIQDFHDYVIPLIDVRPHPDERWCSRGHWVHKTKFSPDTTRGGLQRYCRKCRRIEARRRREMKKLQWNDGKHIAAAVAGKKEIQ